MLDIQCSCCLFYLYYTLSSVCRWAPLHTHPFNGPFPGLPRWAGTRKVKPIWILLKQETVSGSGISWTICKSAPNSRQITTPAPHRSVFYRPDALPAAQPTASKHWRHHTHTRWDNHWQLTSTWYLGMSVLCEYAIATYSAKCAYRIFFPT